ncbi:ABC transporter permease subunit [Cellulomonas sp. PS-H5]|jgi:ABC-2 type transport system permease protein|uniref:ABC transporter permease subunit n=1 Tax=Cellulomonas sp. PS-H5 TaxID=2820400 RepID=UPI001C4E99A7|nr:ABC transporter permease subunit [Cellulomonas sp. PS-H5]MBW0255404.1 ABC transporter permease subunit [Cellulomonas sp. PS-H5]
MSAATATTTPRPARVDAPRVTFPKLVRSEWIKLWTLRSTWWVVIITVLAQAGFTWMGTYFTLQNVSPDDLGISGSTVGPSFVQSGIMIGQLVISVLAVLAITGEYSTGSIRSTFAAAPRRVDAVLAKGVVVLLVAFVTGALATLLSWALITPSLGEAYAIDLSDEIHRRVLIAMPLYLMGVALFSFAIGALLRVSAAALATVFGVFLVVETLFSAFPNIRVLAETAPFLPSNAGFQVLSTSTESIDALRAASDVAVLTPWQGYAVLIAWGVVLLGAALVLVRRRDA